VQYRNLISTYIVIAGVCSVAFSAAFPTSRDPLKWPFASTSIWNMPIGSNAVYQPAGITYRNEYDNCGLGTHPTWLYQDEDIVIQTPTAPMTKIYYNAVGWNGGQDRCAVQGALLQTAPVPADYVVPNTTCNNSTSILMPDGHTILQNQPFTRCTAGANATTLYVMPTDSQDLLTSDGIVGTHGGSLLSAIGGTIRLGEFRAGVIRHAMKIILYSNDYFYSMNSTTNIWPATNHDGQDNGTNPKLGEGSLLALLPSFNVDTLSTPAKILAQAFKDYGAYIVDNTGSNSWCFCTEQGPAGRVVDEFDTLYHIPMTHWSNDGKFMADIIAIFQNLQIVTNNSSNNIGGGGTPRQPLAPDFSSTASVAPLTKKGPSRMNGLIKVISGLNQANSFNSGGSTLAAYDIGGRLIGRTLTKNAPAQGVYLIQ
jgi:hypothetical protein